MTRDRYEVPVRGVNPDDLGARMRASITAVQRHWPENTAITLFISDFGDGGAHGGIAYISNAERASMVETVREWLRRQETLA